MLQQRLNELDSAILNIVNDKVHVLGFMREEMLLSYLNKGTKCWSSMGLYDNRELDFYNIKNDALIIVQKEGKEIVRHQYKPIYRDTIQYKDEAGKNLSMIFTLRKNSYRDHYHILTEKTSLLFNSKRDVEHYLLEEYGASFSF